MAQFVLAATLGIGTTAFAQTMGGGQEVSDADLPAVQQHCQTLAMGSTTATSDPASENADNDSTMMPAENAGTMDGAQPTTGTEGNQDNYAPDPAAAAADPPADDTQGVNGNQDADQFSVTINMK